MLLKLDGDRFAVLHNPPVLLKSSFIFCNLIPLNNIKEVAGGKGD